MSVSCRASSAGLRTASAARSVSDRVGTVGPSAFSPSPLALAFSAARSLKEGGGGAVPRPAEKSCKRARRYLLDALCTDPSDGAKAGAEQA